MRARLTNTSLVLALLIGALLSFVAFAAFHRAISGHLAAGPPLPYPIPIMAAKTIASVAGSAVAVPSIARENSPDQFALSTSGTGPPKERARIPLPPRGTRGPSQLIRTANINIEVRDVTRALRTATFIADEQLGDVIGLNDETPSSPNDAHSATMEIRVPQYRFEQTLDALGRLGKVKAKSVNAQDVSDQIIDAQARLRNLRRTEADILNIMDRSGNIEQVLNVTQELGNVREQIERLDAQMKSMQYQVDYSTINISFSSPAVVTTPTGFALLGEAWKSATESLRNLTVGLLSAGLWLVAFSPYILALALLAALGFRYVRARRPVTTT